MNKWNFNKEVYPPKVKSNGKSIIEYFDEVENFYKK